MSDTKVQSPEATVVVEENTHRVTSPAPPQQQPHWMPMRYPPMVMPHHLMYAPPPYYHHHQFHGHGHGHHQSRGGKHQNVSNLENKTIWVGDLLHWMDENYLNSSFSNAGEISSVKVIRNKHTGLSEGYGFVEFVSHDVAEKVLEEFNGETMLNTDQPFRLNWASFSTGEKRLENGPDLSIFVGDLAPEVTDTLLHELFSEKYTSVKSAKVVLDGNTGRSKGYGFVRFGDESERSKAMLEMSGVKCLSRAMRIGPATPRKPSGYHQQGGLARHEGDSLNTTIFVGGLDSSVSDEDLREPFAKFGEITSVKIPIGKGCGFIQFVNRGDAEEALEKLNGSVIGKQTVRLSWGRNPAKLPRGEFADQWEPYYGGQYYNGYGYMLPPPVDPRMYAAAPYGGYPVYGGPQQQQVS
ncbi:hypothetical protein AALP_AA6G163800 [Arabis alpina]|uniref:RRM domain-containing protein n=1 Tax=Arabis alpina TaxID=50452 RepID=A0A087GPM8_ARAAL|nr:hypothetical protein AALP_AA6G163800 [Arabis alpina]